MGFSSIKEHFLTIYQEDLDAEVLDGAAGDVEDGEEVNM